MFPEMVERSAATIPIAWQEAISGCALIRGTGSGPCIPKGDFVNEPNPIAGQDEEYLITFVTEGDALSSQLVSAWTIPIPGRNVQHLDILYPPAEGHFLDSNAVYMGGSVGHCGCGFGRSSPQVV